MTPDLDEIRQALAAATPLGDNGEERPRPAMSGRSRRDPSISEQRGIKHFVIKHAIGAEALDVYEQFKGSKS